MLRARAESFKGGDALLDWWVGGEKLGGFPFTKKRSDDAQVSGGLRAGGRGDVRSF